MLTLLSIGVAFTFICAAVTFYAIASAKEGYEDELGFHSLSRPVKAPPATEKSTQPQVGQFERLA